MTNHTPLKVGIVGSGIGRLHIQSYRLLPQVEVVALCDVDEVRLEEIGQRYNIPRRYTAFQALFESGEIEAVSICLPNSLHAPVSIAALEAGLHVLCEKPLAESVTAGEKVIEAAAKAPGMFMMCYNRRYRADIRWIKSLLDEGTLGQIYQIKAGWIRETGIPSGWFTAKEISGGGPLVDLGVHILDAVMWLLDYPTPLTVSGAVQTKFGPRQAKTWQARSGQGANFTVEDSATAFIRLSGEISLTLETSWASHARPGMDDIFITLLGTEGSVELYVPNYASENTLTFYTEINGVPVVTRPAVSGAKSDHDYAIAEFVQCILENKLPTATAEHGLTALKIVEAIYASADQGREVLLST